MWNNFCFETILTGCAKLGVSLFTAVEYNCKLTPPVTSWCAKQLDNWTFPVFGSKVEVIKFHKDTASERIVARYQENNTPKSNCLAVAFDIFLLGTIIFPVIVLILRAIIRHNIEFKKHQPPTDSLDPFPRTTVTKPNECFMCLKEKDAGKEMRVPVGKTISITLWHSVTTGHQPWKVAQLPSFIKQLDAYTNDQYHPPEWCGGGNDRLFIFQPQESGRGEIVMEMPGFNATRTEVKRFTIISG